ncbi:MAG: SPOR domain-containing protein [Deltaproteobacteria bacterium]|nr:SPOR domain-containing protein [Deltaproteobacteria bacterium]
MENRLRDLEFIQEKETDDRSRRFGIILLAVLTLIGLTFAIGVVVGRAAKPEDSDVKDPLAELDEKSGIKTQVAKAQGAEKKQAPVKVNREEMIFNIALAEDKERPEVAAALAAAAAEEAELAGFDAKPSEQTAQSEQEITTLPPASVAVVSSRDVITSTAKHDPLVMAAIQETESKSSAPSGREGEYTLQVISYESPEPARAFAEGLRARGHQAYVVSADVPGRGRYYRVRIGPFPSKWKANIYQRQFEETERMSTYVVQKPRDEG